MVFVRIQETVWWWPFSLDNNELVKVFLPESLWNKGRADSYILTSFAGWMSTPLRGPKHGVWVQTCSLGTGSASYSVTTDPRLQFSYLEHRMITTNNTYFSDRFWRQHELVCVRCCAPESTVLALTLIIISVGAADIRAVSSKSLWYLWLLGIEKIFMTPYMVINAHLFQSLCHWVKNGGAEQLWSCSHQESYLMALP